MKTQEELLEEARAAIEQRAEEQWARYAVLAEVAEMVEGRNPYGCNQGGHGKYCPNQGRKRNQQAGNVLVPNNRNARESGGKRPQKPFTPQVRVKKPRFGKPKNEQRDYLPKSEEDLPDGTGKRIAETVQDSSNKLHELCPVKNVRAYTNATGEEHRDMVVLANSGSFQHINRRHGPGNETNHNQIPLSPAHYENVVRTVRNPDSVFLINDEGRNGENRLEVRKEISGATYVAFVDTVTQKDKNGKKGRAGVQIVTCWAERNKRKSPRKKRRRRK